MVIYDSPSDYPGMVVVRRQHSTRRGCVVIDQEAYVFETLADARQALPPGLHNIGRCPSDHPIIIETWV